jgi:hypothetical protein
MIYGEGDDQSTDGSNTTPNGSSFSSRSPQTSAASSVPPRADEWDRTLRHIGLKDFGEALENAARAVFPNDKGSNYSQVYVLLISWQTEDPKLPVEREIKALREVLKDIYHYDIEEYRIPNTASHAAVSEKINDFVKVNDDSSNDLKIVYYAGHSLLSRNKELVWSAYVFCSVPHIILAG